MTQNLLFYPSNSQSGKDTKRYLDTKNNEP